MDVYKFGLYLGFTGLAAMALLGMGHLGSHFHHGHAQAGHGGHGHGGHGHGAHSHGGHRGAARGASNNGNRMDAVLVLLSPRVWFSLMLGFGATGLLIKGLMPLEPWRFLLAACGGVGFEKLLIAPVWNAWAGFASRPARTLESAVCEEARAVTNFDSGGNGLVAIELDGHAIRLLARLSAEQRTKGKRVHAGDRLFVEAVNSARNSCTVSRFDQNAPIN